MFNKQKDCSDIAQKNRRHKCLRSILKITLKVIWSRQQPRLEYHENSCFPFRYVEELQQLRA